MEVEIDQLTDSKDAIKKSNTDLNAKVQELEQEVFDSKTIQLNLMENLKASRDELDHMRIEYERKIKECDNLAAMMGMTMVYITNLNCPIDRVLGDFINSH